MIRMVNAALAYAAQGLPVFPLKQRGKTPLTQHGHKDATTDEATIRAWWGKWPTANIGIRCDGLLVADLDGYEGLQSKAQLEAEHEELPATWTVKTGGGTEAEPKEQGLHLIFKAPPGLNIRPGAGKYGYPAFDIRANDSYIVAPLSVTRLPYETIDASPITDAPAWLIEIAEAGSSSKPQSRPITVLKDGQRHVDLISFIGKWRGRGFTEEEIVTQALALNHDSQAPLPDDEVVKMVRQYAQRKPKELERPEKIDTSQFKALSSQELLEILGLTIKKDEHNKLITFLGELSAYTENSQLNISYNAPSSTGKSYIPTEIARLFPEDDVIEVGYCSPTAFFHDVGEYSKERSGYVVDLSRKILIFLDQPHTLLLQHLRPLLSHDKKEIRLKITDKSQKAGLRTKNILLRGFPSVIFCTSGLKIDEQETTRFILLSPETSQEKIRQGIHEKIRKETDSSAHERALDDNPGRKALKERIRAIKLENVRQINIGSPDKVEKAFLSENKVLKPRHQRDIGRIISLIKAFALLNLWFREKSASTVIADEDDISQAFKVWGTIAESQEYNLPPFIYQLFRDVIVPAWQEKNQDRSEGFEKSTGQTGLTRQEVTHKHLQVYGRVLADWLLRQQIIPMLENAGLITQEQDPNDKRKMLIYPTTPLTISANQNNSELNGGVSPDSDIHPGYADRKGY